MGEVYLADHPRLPRQDALKVLASTVSADCEYCERFSREAEIAATLWHPHIVGVHDRGEFSGRLWISMDYVEGTDAARLLSRQPQGLPPAQVLAIVDAVAGALDYAHQRGLLHRDVKPANILLAHPERDDQRIMLADFGIARFVNDTNGLTQTNTTVGTVLYAAPEQLMGAELDGRADQYALAATTFHLLSGSPPYGHTNAVVISQHLNASLPTIGTRRPELAGLDPVLARAMAKDPRDRFERCADFARALRHQLGQSVGTDNDATTLAPAATRARSRLRAGVLVPAVLVVLLVAAIAVALMEFRRADDERPATTAATSSPAVAPPAATVTSSPPPPPAAAPAPSETPAPAAPAAPLAVIGASCSALGSTATTANGSTAYCSRLQITGASIWSLNPGDVPSPTVTVEPTDEPLPVEEESPVRVCMQQTGLTRRECRESIRRSNGGGLLP
jgi:serine/threonine-protein kinase